MRLRRGTPPDPSPSADADGAPAGVHGPPPRGRRVREAGDLFAVAAAAAGGVLIGAAVAVVVQDSGSPPEASDPTGTTAIGPLTSAAAGRDDGRPTQDRDDRPAAPAPDGPAPGATEDAVLLAWTAGGLDPALPTAAAADPAVDRASVVRGGVLDLVGSQDAAGATVDAPAPGWAIPLDAVALAPAAHAPFVSLADRSTVAALGPDQALLGATSAGLRRLGPGAVVELAGGGSVTIAGVVSDVAIGGAELAVDRGTGERLGVTVDRYLLAEYAGDRAALEDRLRSVVPGDTPVRFRGPGETPFLRHADAVLPQALIKERFGEFAYRPGGGDGFEQDAAWQAQNLVSVDLPIIGRARCHRGIVDALAGALAEAAAANLAALIDREGFAGCWNARTTRNGTSVSRHAWGVAVDLNFGSNPTGLASVQDPRLVAIFQRWGFTDGSRWLVPDAGHFEYLAPPTR